MVTHSPVCHDVIRTVEDVDEVSMCNVCAAVMGGNLGGAGGPVQPSLTRWSLLRQISIILRKYSLLFCLPSVI